ncbi:MAG TPA: nitroreductase [Anaerolineaceae bacterium]
MDVLEAMQKRRSVRSFLSRPVPEETIRQILLNATRSPSGGNGQPWEIFVAAGATMEAIRKAYQQAYQQSGPPPRQTGGTPPPAYIRERMATIRMERLNLLGLDPDDPASGKVLLEMSVGLYGAPALVVLCMDQALNSHFDMGLLAISIVLAAQGFGVDSIIAAAMIAHPEILRQALEIPPHLNIIAGIGLGYADPDSLINTYRSPRRPLDEVVRYKG